MLLLLSLSLLLLLLLLVLALGREHRLLRVVPVRRHPEGRRGGKDRRGRCCCVLWQRHRGVHGCR